MLPDNKIKEKMSLKYIEAIANYNGYSTTVPEDDYGVDLRISEICTRSFPNRADRSYESGRHLYFQIKSTTISQISINEKCVHFALKAKNYNDLIERNNVTSFPLILLLFVMPEDKSEWLVCDENGVLIRKCMYWYVPDKTAEASLNTSTKTIEIDINNLIDIDNLKLLFERFN